jgi:hypothetical protein
MKTMTTEKASLIVLWCAFGVFLLASIPHLAYFFASMEPLGSTGSPAWWFWWAVSFALAGAFDLTDVLLSMRVAKLQKQKQKPTRRIIRTWLFIVGLTALSIYANYEHAAQFSTTMLDKVTGESLFNIPLDLFRFGTLNPILGSFFQLFAIAYTSMAEDIASEEPEEQEEEDLETLRKRAAEAEERARLQTTITTAREPQGQKLVKGVFGLVKGVREEVKDLRSESQDPESAQLERLVQFFKGTPELLSEEHAATTDVMIREMLRLKRVEMARIWRMKVAQVLAQETKDSQTHDRHIIEDEMHTSQTADGQATATSSDESQTHEGTDSAQHPDEHTPHIQTHDGQTDTSRPDKEEIGNQTPPIGSRPSRGPLYLSFEEASTLTGYATDYLRKLVRQGALTTRRDDESRLTVSSVNAYLARHTRLKKTERTAEVARLKVLK